MLAQAYEKFVTFGLLAARPWLVLQTLSNVRDRVRAGGGGLRLAQPTVKAVVKRARQHAHVEGRPRLLYARRLLSSPPCQGTQSV
jgi:hypothetical protein